MAIPTIGYQSNLKIAQIANALYGTVVGKTTNDLVLADITVVGFSATANSYYTFTFGTQTAAQVAATMVSNLGITATSVGSAANVTIATDYIEAQITAAPGAEGAAISAVLTTWSGLAADATFGAAATAWNATIADAQAYTNSGATADVAIADAAVGATYTLTTGVEAMLGTAGADTFNAYILNNSNTLQSGDVIDGGAGIDTLYADMGTSSAFAVTAQTSNIENITIRAQAIPTDATNGNNMTANTVQVDAQRMSGVTKWESNNSRSDVIIEDVRINSNASTIAFVESDPGNVDLGVYFNQRNLVNTTSGSSSLNLQIMDTVSTAAGTAPLLNSTYGSFTFTATVDGVSSVITLASQAIQDAQTYVEMVAAFQAALDAQFGAGTATATVGSNFTVTDPASGTSCTGQSVVLTTLTPSVTFTTPAGSGWESTGVAPPASNFYTNWSTGASSSAALVSTSIILDDVGMGSIGGDLVVGGMSTGATSSSKGVELFNIEVRDNSQLQTINSTNNTLKEVVITNGTTSSSSTAYVDTATNAGNLTVNGTGTADTVLAGTATGSTAGHSAAGAAGFTDVRLINASAMTGQFAFTAAVTSDSIAKYINLVDTAASATADVATAGEAGLGANFAYNGGANNDTMVVTIDADAVASRSTVVSGLSDMTFAIDGGAGNDAITVRIDTTTAQLTGGAQNWANNQDMNNNISITGGAGDDVIRTPGAGDMIIDAGAGVDVVYTDNTGVGNVGAAGALTTNDGKAAWVFNTVDQVTTTAGAVAADARNIANLRGDADSSYNLFNAQLYVTFKGLQSATITLSNATTYKTTDFEINQAIKNAINTDATLKNLLVATDGPAGTLVVESLIDGLMAAGDLAVSLNNTTTALTAAQLTAVNTAWGTAYASSTAALAGMGVVVTAFGTKGDYASALATTASSAADIAGADSTVTSDNFITPGAGDDIIVLGTNSSGASVGLNSNEVVTFAASFGNDVIVNFDATAGVARDHLDLSAFLGTATVTLGALANTNGLVTVAVETTANDTVAEIKALYDAVDAVTAKKMVYIAYSTVAASVTDKTLSVAKVYSVTDGTAADDSTVTLQGTIDLADTGWATLTVENFTKPSATAEGSSSLAPTLATTLAGQTLTGSGLADTFTVAHAGAVIIGNGGNDVINIVTAGAATINDLNTGDAFTVSAGATLTNALAVSAFVATSATTNAGTATLTAAVGGGIINMALAGGTVGYTLAGAAGNDTLTGSAFADIISSGGGNDTITGGAGIDAITGGTGVDTISFTGVALAANRDNVTAFTVGADIIGLDIDYTTAATAAGAVAAVEDEAAAAANVNGATYDLGTLTAGNTNALDLVTLDGATLTNTANTTLAGGLDGTALLAGLVAAGVGNTASSITMDNNGDSLYIAATQGGVGYLYIAAAGADNLAVAAEITLVGTFAADITGVLAATTLMVA